MSFVQQVRQAISHLNPGEIRQIAERPLRVLLVAGSEAGYTRMEAFLLPPSLSSEKLAETSGAFCRAGGPSGGGRFHLSFYERGTAPPDGFAQGVDAFGFDPRRPRRLVESLIESREEYGLALARISPPFREAVAEKTIQTICQENALFSLLTALPNVLPSLASLPWAIGELASDTAVLTANQIRMAFLLAAASDRAVGYREQRNEIGSIIAGAWGWRTAARQLSGKIPFGGGLIPKAAIAYAGTYVVGQTLERIYRLGYGLTREERHEAYEAAFARGREVAGSLLERVRPRTDQP